MLRLSLRPGLLLAGLLLFSLPLAAEDRFLTIGGGPVADGNQISLENNVLFFQRVLSQLGLEKAEHQILFADGSNPAVDLQYENVDRDPEDIHRLLAEIVGPGQGIKFDYRSSTIPGISGEATPESIEKTLADLSHRLNSDDRVIFYFTGHGGKDRTRPAPPPKANDKMKEEDAKSDDTKEEETDHKKEADKPAKKTRREPTYSGNVTHLWYRDKMTAKEWTEKLDELPPNVPFVAVMVQCYSGGFGNLIFKGGDPDKGLADHRRCGFFSTVPDRVAAGCTPNVDQAEYREYSSYFWEALSGVSRIGESIEKPDFDQDGVTTLLEAHAYTVLHADTIDIPTRTSDFFLREYSTLQGENDLATIHTPIDQLMAGADASEQAVIEGLSGRFEFSEVDRGKQVEEAIRDKKGTKRKVDGDVRRQLGEINGLKQKIRESLEKKWPVITNPWHPQTMVLLTEEPDYLRSNILEHEEYPSLKKATTKLEELRQEQEALELEIVKLERLKFWLERRARVLNLENTSDSDMIQRLHALVELESQSI
ncbi:hypothetical protein Pan97_46040 [Bremerella volcania]|uniref:Caspase domain protein n=1 Tax=Bremerella volcania TaxID=2527984 RepID=A0A518CE84_9BACT|nr:hypothetical protein [Bremerella volcania]QDU77533.1 hypothetical protein Pan97_46040 [Bremerella volcania]